jgi:hypothetical protein
MSAEPSELSQEQHPVSFDMPEFFINDPTMTEEKHIAVSGLLKLIQYAPDLAQEGLDVYDKSRDTLPEVLAFARENPQTAIDILEAWNTIIGERVDFDLTFDAATEAVIENDPDYKKNFEAFKREQDSKYRDKFLRRRLTIFMERSKAAAEAA